MTSQLSTSDTAAAAPAGKPTNALRQMWALIRMEFILLRRNWTSAGAAMLLLGIGIMRADDKGGGVDGALNITSMIGFLGVFVVHHHLATVYASRRQEMVLKRLRSGSASENTILVGTGSSAVFLFLVQAVILMGYGAIAVGMPFPVNPLTVLIGLLLGATVMAGFAALVSAITRSSEAAMLTTLPTMVLFLATPGMLVPFGAFPEAVEKIAYFSPLGPLADVMRTGWVGVTADGTSVGFVGVLVDALPAFAVLVMWLVILSYAIRRYFRWEPREG